jgi:hypothetical protein
MKILSITGFVALLMYTLQTSAQPGSIQAYEFHYDTTANLAPGCKIPIQTYAFGNGKRFQTPGHERMRKGYKRIKWNKFDVEVSGGKLRKNAIVVSSNLQDLPDHKVTITIAHESGNTSSTYEIPMTYINRYHASYSGSDGQSGNSEFDHGGHGENGNDLEVSVSTQYNVSLQKELLWVQTIDLQNNTSHQYLINPDGGSISITANGGDGGDGYNGHDGENGKDGWDGDNGDDGENGRDEMGSCACTNGEGGGDADDGENGEDGEDGEHGSDAGFGGNGGTITVFVDAKSKPYLHLLSFTNNGGNPGAAGIGGKGGRGGKGGYGGEAGQGGTAGEGGCYNGDDGYAGDDGSDGQNGRRGSSGRQGHSGQNGPPPVFIYNETEIK